MRVYFYCDLCSAHSDKDASRFTSIGVDLGGSPGTCPPIIEKRPCIYHFLPHFSPRPNILVCPPNILTSLRQCLQALHFCLTMHEHLQRSIIVTNSDIISEHVRHNARVV